MHSVRFTGTVGIMKACSSARLRMGLRVLTALCLIGVVGLLRIPVVHAQTQQCGGPNQPSCAPPPPARCTIPGWGVVTICQPLPIAPLTYVSGDTPYGGGRAPGDFSSLASWQSAFMASFPPCGVASITFSSPSGQTYADGALSYQYQDFQSVVNIWNGTSCVPDLPSGGYVLEHRNISCPNAAEWALVPDDTGAYVCACRPNADCSVPRCPKVPLNKGDPCDVTIGNLSETATDYGGAGTASLQFTRSYNSLTASQHYVGNDNPPLQWPFGVAWSATYFQFIAYTSSADSGWTGAYVHRPDGSVLAFNEAAGVFAFGGELSDTLAWTYDIQGNKTGWSYTTASADQELYNLSGQLLSVTSRGGAVQTLSYNSSAI